MYIIHEKFCFIPKETVSPEQLSLVFLSKLKEVYLCFSLKNIGNNLLQLMLTHFTPMFLF